MDAEKQNYDPQETGRPEHSRRLFLIVVILAFFGLIGGFWSLKTGIEQPLAFTNTGSIKNTSSQSNDVSSEAALLVLKDKDSDKDELTDYDELYVHGSSPYLADSDSDGIDDKTEVTNGDDPNCPTGTTCTPIAVFAPSNTNANTNASGQTITAEDVDVEQLRITLRNAGAPQAELDSMTDEELVAAYQRVLQEDAQTNANTNTDQAVDSIDVAELRDLTPDEIRQLLVLGGADAASLEAIDDQTLREIFLESVQNIQTGQ